MSDVISVVIAVGLVAYLMPKIGVWGILLVCAAWWLMSVID